jgi:hypothetical protein
LNFRTNYIIITENITSVVSRLLIMLHTKCTNFHSKMCIKECGHKAPDTIHNWIQLTPWRPFTSVPAGSRHSAKSWFPLLQTAIATRWEICHFALSVVGMCRSGLFLAGVCRRFPRCDARFLQHAGRTVEVGKKNCHSVRVVHFF